MGAGTTRKRTAMIGHIFAAMFLPTIQRIRKWIWNFEMRLVSKIEE